MNYNIEWPEGKDFAFTILDDADNQTVENGKPVYDFLYECGFRTSKAIWPLGGTQHPYDDPNDKTYQDWIGSTCDDPHYLNWVKELERKGFEIALHNVTYHSSVKKNIEAGLKKFHDHFGKFPTIHANHGSNKDNLYWGDMRVSGINRVIYNVLTRCQYRNKTEGHIEISPYFCGDIFQEKIKFVRNFVFNDINTYKMCPLFPYHDPQRPYVNQWFASSEGPEINSFVELLSEKNQEQLLKEKGLCIVYTHFGKNFFEDGKLNPQFVKLMKMLSQRNGWFVPVSEVLNYLLRIKGHTIITDKQRSILERQWLKNKILNGGTS